MITLRDTKARWDRAACVDADSEDFFPTLRRDSVTEMEATERALAVCAVCEIREQCLDYAMRHGEHGIWGGLTEEQRRSAGATRRRIHCPGCHSPNVMRDLTGLSQVCTMCGLSWKI